MLTKPIGIGVLTTAQKAEMLSAEGRALAEKLMTTLNKSARDAMVKYRVHACTDVTGFGLLGHSYEMAQGSDVELELEVDAIDLIPEALEFANMGLLPAGMYRNRAFAEVGVDAGETALCRQDLLYDPQTAGGPPHGRGPGRRGGAALGAAGPRSQCPADRRREGLPRRETHLPAVKVENGKQVPAGFLAGTCFAPVPGGTLKRAGAGRGGGLEVDQHRPGIHNGSDEGEAMMAGSMWSCLAAMGSIQPTSLASTTVAARDRGDHQGDGAVMVLKVDPQAVGRG